jgi:hypothetical protein
MAVLLAAAYVLSQPHSVCAQDDAGLFRAGEFDGRWHGYKAKFSIQEVHDTGLWDGIGEFLEGPKKGIKFGIAAQVHKEDNSLIITRHVAGATQVSTAEAPELIDGVYVWKGRTWGVGLKEGDDLAFEVRIPKR